LLVIAIAGVAGRWLPLLDMLNSVAPLTASVSAGVAGFALWRRSGRAVFVAMLAMALAAVPVVREAARAIPAKGDDAATDSVTVVTHNVRFDNHDAAHTAAILQHDDADIILLQETDRLDWGKLFSSIRYPYRSACRATGCSLLILSKWPIVASRYRIRDPDGAQIGPRLVWATIAPPGRQRFDVATLHLDWPGPAQARQRRELAQSIGGLGVERLILAGDFNLTPWAWAMRDSDADLAPLTRMTRASWSYPARIGAGSRVPLPFLPIDQLFAGPGWALGAVERLPRTGSDHYPLRIRLIARPI
jgi:endonuclease/exonuclease/phosphatase (EEP) superfamily protein YafD